MKNSLGIKLLGVFLVVEGLRTLLGLSFNYMYVVTGVLALVAGILLLVGK
jgi:hypothetical protein